ncbi:hypothetical protein Ddc_13063 [Ditylenchus destructor]|nr:hypothetical protein Ddc_13063 [Ditylenchus destructor]
MLTSAKFSTLLTFTALIIFARLDLMSIGAAQASLFSPIPRQKQNPGNSFVKADNTVSLLDLGRLTYYQVDLQDDKSKRFVRDVAVAATADVVQDKSFNWEELSAMDDCFVSYEPGFDGSSKNNKSSKKGKKRMSEKKKKKILKEAAMDVAKKAKDRKKKGPKGKKTAAICQDTISSSKCRKLFTRLKKGKRITDKKACKKDKSKMVKDCLATCDKCSGQKSNSANKSSIQVGTANFSKPTAKSDCKNIGSSCPKLSKMKELIKCDRKKTKDQYQKNCQMSCFQCVKPTFKFKDKSRKKCKKLQKKGFCKRPYRAAILAFCPETCNTSPH